MVIYAWVGEDELGSGEVGLKQGFTNCGLIPLVQSKTGRLDTESMVKQMQAQANASGKAIYLCRFTFDAELITVSKC